MPMRDPFFERVRDGEWNACVGTQGFELNYVEGFLDAAAIVADALVDGEMFGGRDTLAMPILYNARHGLELALKFVIGSLARSGMIADRPGDPDHDIFAYWEHLDAQSVPDHRSRELVTKLRPFVVSLDAIDKNGGELRYFENRDGRRSLGRNPTIHLKLVRANVHRLKSLVRALTDRVEGLEVEWPTGTFTKLLSRTDLVEVAKMLGPRSTWTEADFDDRRKAVKVRFGIGNGPLTEAINTIERSGELGVHLGKLSRPEHLTGERLIELADLWLAAHPPRQGDGKVAFLTSQDISQLLENGLPEQAKLDQMVLERFSLEEVADAETLYYVGTVPLLGEEYEAKLRSVLAQHEVASKAQGSRWDKVHHIMSKTSFLAGLMRGLRRTGSPDMADAISELAEATTSKRD
ncbi:hypothetical protein [Erythrobacter crassostreae]|uniref:Uncharacterized protein n=1 Tax=Erythrobacter crassostreae TaxID=2828328 RepID=A0A9X1F2B3_9SPHN|nr:hypothetical protein [Erythrobacter crassostrea]MBV7259005.1 hypothetical protein [Erythrobacter crassostrea]